MIDTPNLNRLAGQSVLFDFAIADTPDLITGIHSIWSRSHAANRATVATPNCLMNRLAKNGISSILFTDDQRLANSPSASGFDRIVEIDSLVPVRLAKDPSDSWLADFFAQALVYVQQLEPGSMLWVHCRALSGPWDAPYDYRSRFADEEDPNPPDDAEPPQGTFDQETDSPDILLGHQQSCAAQLVLLDEFLGILLDEVASSDSALFSLLSTRGFPLGEHGQIGDPMNLNSESIHVPYMIRWPDARHAFRSQSLIELSSLHDVLCDWFGIEQDAELSFLNQVIPIRESELAISVFGKMQSIQTHAWKLIRSQTNDEPRIRLYKKPDDRWEVNDVFDRCPHVAKKLEELLDESLDQLAEGKSLKTSIDRELAFDV